MLYTQNKEMRGLEKLKVIYEDNHLIAVNKPAGYLVQGDKTGDLPLVEIVKSYIKVRYKKPGDVFLGVIHRIDRPVSGVVIFARTSKALIRMNKLFQDRKIEKKYWAITHQRPNPINGEIRHYLLKDRTKNKTKAYDRIGKRTSKAKLSFLTYQLIGEVDGSHLLEVLPQTGRPHQIRVQLSEINCPIIGDIKYGYRKANTDGSILLHSRELKFIHPVKKEAVEIVANLPKGQIWDKFLEF